MLAQDIQQSILKHVSPDPLPQRFGELFLQHCNERMLAELTPQQLGRLLESRFRFFSEALSSSIQVRVAAPRDEDGMSGRLLVDVVCRDAPYSVITVDSVLRQFGLRVVRRLHPMISVQRDAQGNLTGLGRVEPDAEVYDVMSIELEANDDRELLRNLHLSLQRHLLAVRLASQGQARVQQRMQDAETALGEGSEELRDLLGWLQRNFACFGSVLMSSEAAAESEGAFFSHGLGILGKEFCQELPELEQAVMSSLWPLEAGESPVRVDRLYVTSPILRFEPLLRVCLPFTHGRRLVLVGLLKRSAQNAPGREVPLVRQKLEYILKTRGFLPDTFDYNEIFRLFAATPLFELLRSSEEELLRLVDFWLSVHSPHQVHAFQLSGEEDSLLKLLVLVPNRLFSEASVELARKALAELIPHQHLECFTAEGDEISRVHAYLTLPDASWKPELGRIEREVAFRITPWEERLREAMLKAHPGAMGGELYARYLPLLPAHYRARTNCAEAVRDIEFLERLPHESGIAFNLVPFEAAGSQMSGVSLLYIYSNRKIDLLHSMPILHNLGVHVFDQLTARIGNEHLTLGFVQSFRISRIEGGRLDEDEFRPLLIDLLRAVFEGRAENDPLNALSVKVKLDWRAIHVLQLYRNLYLQLGAPYSRETINSTLLGYGNGARLLWETFVEKFDPSASRGTLEYRNSVVTPRRAQQFRELLEQVDDMTDDVILRRLHNLVQSSLRTNFFIPKPSGETFLSVKLKSPNVEQMPVPSPFREIFVHDVSMEGTHLRFGPVARGGLRWSDRLDDFRTEVLGLVKTQQTKNVVIVPVGSKGGFVVKGPKRDDPAESLRQYRKFISALLDITDTRDEQGQIRHPNHVLAYDGPDPYLVVAADKGTATFSDTANEISAQYGFWLDDAFASGGSNGYDHKKVGITARGAWECVKLHFREMGQDIQTEPFTAIGVGDMSGDVFGNGMLLSRATRLQAAFNHLHIFLDPNPDPETSWEERNRMFQMPRSTWRDYDREKLSSGGGIYDRKAKAIPLSPEARAMLQVEAEAPTGEEVVRAILKMEADLLWLGGIGTYVKSPLQNNLQVGDQANDGVRINSDELRVKVVGEGANLGLTQLARIDCANRGVHINTDAIDNSAGVNMSDYEVNLKILLQHLKRQGHLASMEERNALLHQATEEVAKLLLANNRGQHRLLSMDITRSLQRFSLYRSIIPWLQEHGLNLRSEYIPGTKDLDFLEQSGLPMPRPVLAVMQAYVKMHVYEALSRSDLLLRPEFLPLYLSYLPESLKERFGALAEDHPLRREITATVLTNAVVNQAGCAFFPHLLQASGSDVEAITQVYFLVDSTLDGARLRERVWELPEVEEQERYDALLAFEDALRQLLASLIQSGVTLESEAGRRLPGLLQDLLGTSAGEMLDDALTPQQVLDSVKALSQKLGQAPDVAYLYQRWQCPISLGQQWLEQLDAGLGLEWMQSTLEELTPQNEWELQHQDLLLQGLALRKRRLLDSCLAQAGESTEVPSVLELLQAQAPQALQHFQGGLEQIRTNGPISLTTLAVLLSQLEALEARLEASRS